MKIPDAISLSFHVDGKVIDDVREKVERLDCLLKQAQLLIDEISEMRPTVYFGKSKDEEGDAQDA